MPGDRLLPADAGAAGLQPLDAKLELLRPLRAPAGMGDGRGGPLRELKRMMKELAPASEINGLTGRPDSSRPRTFLKNSRRLSGFGVMTSTCASCAIKRSTINFSVRSGYRVEREGAEIADTCGSADRSVREAAQRRRGFRNSRRAARSPCRSGRSPADVRFRRLFELADRERDIAGGAHALEAPVHEFIESAGQGAVLRKSFRQNDRILDGHAAASGQVRGHGVGGVADENHAPAIPGRWHQRIFERPPDDFLRERMRSRTSTTSGAVKSAAPPSK